MHPDRPMFLKRLAVSAAYGATYATVFCAASYAACLLLAPLASRAIGPLPSGAGIAVWWLPAVMLASLAVLHVIALVAAISGAAGEIAASRVSRALGVPIESAVTGTSDAG